MKRFAGTASAALCVLAAVCLTVTLLLTSVQFVASNEQYYQKAYERFGVAEQIGATDETLDAVTQTLLSYLKGDRDNLGMQAQIDMKGEEETEVFTQTEKAHMVDVFWLFRMGFILRDVALALFAILAGAAFFVRKDGFAMRGAKTMLISLAAAVLLLGVGAVMLLTDFSDMFIRFHELFFTNDLWLLDVDLHVLINLVPEEFFSGIARDIVLVFCAMLATVCILCGAVLLYTKKTRRKAA